MLSEVQIGNWSRTQIKCYYILVYLLCIVWINMILCLPCGRWYISSFLWMPFCLVEVINSWNSWVRNVLLTRRRCMRSGEASSNEVIDIITARFREISHLSRIWLPKLHDWTDSVLVVYERESQGHKFKFKFQVRLRHVRRCSYSSILETFMVPGEESNLDSFTLF